ncbi:glycosyltransferase family 4 protein [Halopelagius longus]|uniref:Glycosyltransferase family 1 protein n=1 Tax=Halopelagius longus TaxID=1236180 RepID=A0A1H1GJU1_9EURY|nr:glycosyltransferase family 4 protein [Halopelagius longus]RDI69699.1 glycosyltransferase family 1 protein [Halopelagius longus]SDR13435.1 Glycosyltransferase involved in cell wall bisynthesis [Halopelagius longus]
MRTDAGTRTQQREADRTRTKRILIRSSIPLRSEFEGGADRLMVKVGEALRNVGWDVHFLSPAPRGSAGDNDLSTESDVTFHDFDYAAPDSSAAKILNSVRGASFFRKLVREVEFDVVLDDISHIPFYPAHFLSPDSVSNALFVHTLYLESANRFLGENKGRIIHLIERTLPYLDDPTVVCAGPSTASRVQGGLGHDRTAILNPCIELDAFDFNPTPESKTVLYLGRLTRRKNVGTLLDAWRRVEAESDEYELVVAGTGYKEDELHERAARLGLQNVDFRGYVSEREKRRLLSESALFVIPSLMEGYVTTGLEALASGTPIVGTDTYGVHDYVVDGDNGRLVDPEDAGELGSVLIETLGSPDDISRMAEQGRETAEDHSFAKFTERADELFTSISAGDNM